MFEEKILHKDLSYKIVAEIHKAQTLNYLKATNYRLALLINFGKYKLEYDRLVL